LKKLRTKNVVVKTKNTKRLQNLEMMKNASKRFSNSKNNGKKMQNNQIEVTEDNVADVFNDEWYSSKPLLKPKVING
jgi:hypothetical protein